MESIPCKPIMPYVFVVVAAIQWAWTEIHLAAALPDMSHFLPLEIGQSLTRALRGETLVTIVFFGLIGFFSRRGSKLAMGIGLIAGWVGVARCLGNNGSIFWAIAAMLLLKEMADALFKSKRLGTLIMLTAVAFVIFMKLW